MKNKAKYSHKHHVNLLALIISLIGVALFGTIIVGLSLRGLDQKDSQTVNQLPQYPAEPVVAKVSLALESSPQVNSDNMLAITIDTGNARIDSASIVLKYDPEKIEVRSTGYQGNVFDTAPMVSVDSASGIVRITGWFNSLTDVFGPNKTGTFAKLSIKHTNSQNTTVTILCGQSDQSNLTYLGENVLNCTALSNLTFAATQATVTPTTTPNTTGGTGGGSSASTTPACSTTERVKNLKAVTSSNRGEVILTWSKVDGADNYNIVYGEKWLDWQYGATNVGNVDGYTVRGLKPGVIYNFAVSAVNGCGASGISDGVAAYAGAGPKTIVTNTNSWGYQAGSGNKGQVVIATPVPEIEATPEATPFGTVEPEEPLATATPTPIIYTEDQSQAEPSIFEQILSYLPWIGLVILLVLGILLVSTIIGKPKAKKVKEEPQELFKDGDEIVFKDMEQ